MIVKHLDHLNMTVAHLEESLSWYQRIFGFEVVERGLYRGIPWAILRAGDALLCLYEHPELESGTGGYHHLSHFGLRITDRASWERTIREQHLEVRYGGEVRWPRSSSWYVADPTGHEIEVVLWDRDVVSFAEG